jgi:hypothetical protein
MGLADHFKSKKIRIGLVGIGVIVLGFFVFMFMNSGGSDVTPERSRPAHKTRTKSISKPKEDAPTQSPLFEALKKWKDPFRNEDPKLVELQDRIDATKKQIEYLKVSLEEKKLRQEMKELDKSMHPPGSKKEVELGSKEKVKGQSQKGVLVKAILTSDDEKSALIVSGSKKSWIHEGEEFDGWSVKQIKKDRVVLIRAGKTYVFFYDRLGFSEEGKL